MKRYLIGLLVLLPLLVRGQAGTPFDIPFFAGPQDFGYIPNAVTFDGSNDYMTVTNSQAGLANGYNFTHSFWIKPTIGVTRRLWSISDVSTPMMITTVASDGRIGISIYSAAGVLKVGSATVNPLSNGTWQHVLFVYSRSTPLTNIYVGGSLVALTNGTWVGNDGNPNGYAPASANARYTVGADYEGSNKLLADICEWWWDDTILDDPTKFRSAANRPISLGSDGSLPSGSAPVFYFRGAGNAFNVNYGTGGTNFWVKGSLSAATPP